MDSLSSFFDMGGYGAFIWPSFALSAVVLGIVFASSLRDLKTNRAALAALEEQTRREA